MIRCSISRAFSPAYCQMTLTTGISMAGNISVAVRSNTKGVVNRSNSAATTNVYGRRRASRTVHIRPFHPSFDRPWPIHFCSREVIAVVNGVFTPWHLPTSPTFSKSLTAAKLACVSVPVAGTPSDGNSAWGRCQVPRENSVQETKSLSTRKGKGLVMSLVIGGHQRDAAIMSAAVARVKCKGGDWLGEPEAVNRSRTRPGRDLVEPERHFHLLHEIFEAQADARPEAPAVVYGREETTYLELERRANRLARQFCARGVLRGSLVAMLLPRSVDAYATLLGILKAGAAYVPLDPEYPADRVAYILENCAASALVTVAELAVRHAGFGGAVIRVDADGETIDAESSIRLPRNAVGVTARDLCYVIYTSG